MANHTNQLLDKVEELLIENRALASALEVVKRFLPPPAHEKVRLHIEEMTSDPTLRELVRRRFVQFRDPTPESGFSQRLQEEFEKGVSRSPAKVPSREATA